MKKVIIVICILVLMLAAGVAEIFVTDRIYSDLYSRLKEIESVLDENPKQLNSLEATLKMDETIRVWEKHRDYIFTVNNHMIMRSFDEKLVTLKEQIEINADQDAPVTLAATLNFLAELREDNFPKLKNIL